MATSSSSVDGAPGAAGAIPTVEEVADAAPAGTAEAGGPAAPEGAESPRMVRAEGTAGVLEVDIAPYLYEDTSYLAMVKYLRAMSRPPS